MEETKKCPHCGQEIKAVAKKCRFCGKWIDEPSNSGNQTSRQNNSAEQKNAFIKYAILAVVVVAAIMMAYNSLSKKESQPSTGDSYTQPIDDKPIEYMEETPEGTVAPTDGYEEDYSEFE